jgi:hypothetical protein
LGAAPIYSKVRGRVGCPPDPTPHHCGEVQTSSVSPLTTRALYPSKTRISGSAEIGQLVGRQCVPMGFTTPGGIIIYREPGLVRIRGRLRAASADSGEGTLLLKGFYIVTCDEQGRSMTHRLYQAVLSLDSPIERRGVQVLPFEFSLSVPTRAQLVQHQT